LVQHAGGNAEYCAVLCIVLLTWSQMLVRMDESLLAPDSCKHSSPSCQLVCRWCSKWRSDYRTTGYYRVRQTAEHQHDANAWVHV